MAKNKKIKVLIDVGHPAHVHYYRNLATELLNDGHDVFWTVKDITIAKSLLDYYGFKYTILPKKVDSLLGKVFMQLLYDIKILRICTKKKIDLAIGTSVSVAHVSRISSVKSITFDDDDDDVQPLVTKFVHPFADHLLSPDALRNTRKKKDTIFYPGYHELAYLHPKRFQPDRGVLAEVGLTEKDTFFIMRFNVFKAHHDVGVKGLSLEQKLELVKILKPYGKIFITTEREIEPELKEYQIKISPEKIHSFIAYATLFLGDSQTMTSEAAVLGVPALRCNSFARSISTLQEEEDRFGLTYGFLPCEFDKMLIKVHELLATTNIKLTWKRKREKMLKDKIDVTSFWCWFLVNYPNSVHEIVNNSRFWRRFR